MRRRLLVIIRNLALLACLAIVALWIIGYREVGGFVITAGEYEVQLLDVPGGIFFTSFPNIAGNHIRFVTPNDAWDPQVNGVFMSGSTFAGFRWVWEAQGYRAVIIPHWALLTAAVATAVIVNRRLGRARRRGEMNLCRNCGYDLRASPERCPECGLAVSRKQLERLMKAPAVSSVEPEGRESDG